MLRDEHLFSDPLFAMVCARLPETHWPETQMTETRMTETRLPESLFSFPVVRF